MSAAASVQPGDALPELVTRVGEVQAFAFSAATHNPHRIHYDLSWARDREGYPGLVVQGPLQTALMVRQVTDWAGPRARVESVAISNRAIAHVGQELICRAEVQDVSPAEPGSRVVIAVTCRRDDTVLAEGQIVVLQSS
ncbi:hypothetical protein ACIA03_26220 [Nocardioides sp. NPDC051685]|uniref:hypothetical protein n=1 Tax=Nocardioides sp. NPDC051685 TaxID=3364334 RepID=UPI0037A6C289